MTNIYCSYFPIRKNRTWIFSVKTKEWKKVDLHGRLSGPYDFDLGAVQAVAVII